MSTDVRPHLLGDTLLMARRCLTLTVRSPTSLVVTAVFPVILLLFLSVSFAEIVMPGEAYATYVNYAVPIFAAMGITFATAATAMGAHADRISGFDDRVRTMPVAALAPVAGRVVADTARNLSTVVVVTVVGVALGFRFDGPWWGVPLYFVVPLIYGFGLAWLMVALAMYSASAESATAGLNALLLVLTFLSTGYVRLEDLPGWAQPVAQANPISHVVEAMRVYSASGDGGALNVLAVAAWTLGLTVVFGFLAVRGFSRRR